MRFSMLWLKMPAANKRWLVLVGGGGCGRWQGGAISALDRAGLLDGLSGIVGTSVGGLNACVLAAGFYHAVASSAVKAAWQRIQKDEDVYKPSVIDITKNPWLNSFTILGMAKNTIWGSGALDRTPLENLTKDILENLTTADIFAKTGINLITRAYNYEKGQVHSLQGSLRDMALATSAIEGAFPSWQGYGDGGAGDNAPIDTALNFGAKQIIVVYCGPDKPAPMHEPVLLGPVDKQTHSTGLSNLLAVANKISQSNEDLVAQIAEKAMADGVQLIECYPPSDTGNFLDFTERGLWARGFSEATSAIQAAKALGW